MEPVTLRSERLVLSIPTLDDAERVFEYCQDPLFETYLSTPWPYHRSDAEHFLGEIVPSGWRLGREHIWALREHDDGPLLGVVGLHRRRADDPGSLDVGYWLGAPHRGHGYMAEAVRAAVAWAFENAVAVTVHWECAVGNIASARTARAAGFRFTGIGPSQVATRDGGHPDHWHGRRLAGDVDGTPAYLAWPAEVTGEPAA
ncbi:GNAT family N-acetyltransferase [Gryllotalpicola koreensis]|uniref:GNAT family protein n=1 Tax=Gryllotalpicola koreensis TaxID=993086 RepID=A0ABP8A137_9MICO